MPHLFKNQLRHAATAVLVGAAATAFTACENKEPRVYRAPRELPPPAASKAPEDDHSAHAHADLTLPRVTFATPEGWQEGHPDQMNVTQLAISAAGGAATVTVTPLPDMTGRDGLLVNMWREQVGQNQLSDEDVAKALTEVTIGDAKGRQFEVSGSRGGKPTRIVTAFVHREDKSWFFKLQGDTPTVEASVPAFAGFLKSVKFEAPAAPPAVANTPAPAPPPPPAPAPTPATPVAAPEGWTAVAPGPMQAAKFTVPPQGDAKAEVTVSIFPNDTGGTVANVKRWRGQIGLPDVDDATILASAKPLEGSEGALIVDLENGARMMVGAIVPRGGEWHFLKLTGDTAAVKAARAAFVAFAGKK